MPFESLGAVSYSPSIVPMTVSVAVCEIFSVTEWNFVKIFDAGKTRMIELLYGEKTMTIC